MNITRTRLISTFTRLTSTFSTGLRCSRCMTIQTAIVFVCIRTTIVRAVTLASHNATNCYTICAASTAETNIAMEHDEWIRIINNLYTHNHTYFDAALRRSLSSSVLCPENSPDKYADKRIAYHIALTHTKMRMQNMTESARATSLATIVPVRWRDCVSMGNGV